MAKTYISNDILSVTTNPLLDYTKYFIDDPTSTKIDKVTQTPDNIIFTLDNYEDSSVIESMNTFINDKNRVYYHNFSFFEPLDTLDANLAYKVKRYDNSDLKQKYSDLITARGITSEKQIKNYYSFDTVESQDQTSDDKLDLKKYYFNDYSKKKLNIPQPDASWSNKSIFLFSNQQIQNYERSVLGLKYLTSYNEIYLPPLLGITEEKFASSVSYLMSLRYRLQFLDLTYQDLDFYKFFLDALLIKKAEPVISLGFNGDQTIRTFDLETLCKSSLYSSIQLNSLKTNTAKDDKNYGKIGGTAVYDLIDKFLKENVKNIFQNIKSRRKTAFAPLFYKIEKYDSANTLVQQFYIPITYREGIRFIDNQVLPDKTYKYRINIIMLSVGYSYTFTKSTIANKTLFTLNNSSCTLDSLIMDVPFIEELQEESTVEYPCIPEVNFYSVLNNPSSLKIFFSKKQAYENEIDRTGAYVKKSDGSLEDQKHFSGKNIKYFQMYKTTNKPNSLGDIASAPVINLDASKTEIIENIELNKRYYFMFRSFYEGKLSNPSDVYEVYLQVVNDTVFPYISKVIFEKENSFLDGIDKGLYSGNKSIFKSIFIKPSFLQLNVVESNGSNTSYKDSTLSLDSQQNIDSIFSSTDNLTTNATRLPKDYRYKLRFTSKKTGNIIDINVKFRYVIDKSKVL